MRKVESIIKSKDRTGKEIAYLLFYDFSMSHANEASGYYKKPEYDIQEFVYQLSAKEKENFELYYSVFIHVVLCYNYISAITCKFNLGSEHLRDLLERIILKEKLLKDKSLSLESKKLLYRSVPTLDEILRNNKLPEFFSLGTEATKFEYQLMIDGIGLIEAANCYFAELFKFLGFGELLGFKENEKLYYLSVKLLNDKINELYNLLGEDERKKAEEAFPIYDDFTHEFFYPDQKKILNLKKAFRTDLEKASILFINHLQELKKDAEF